MDNGSVYISRHFASVLAELKIHQLHHKPYQAHAKGKIEALQKTIKYEFQLEAQRAGFLTLEELNTAFWAWADLEYNRRIHSSTGQSPEERFLQGLPAEHQRLSDLLAFQRMFLWKEQRTVSKWGKITLYSNLYPVRCRPPGSVVQVRFTPFDLGEIYIYDPPATYQETSRPSSQKNTTAPRIPEESSKSPQQISQQSVAYFTRLREKYLQAQKQAQEVSFQTLKDPHTEDPHA